MSEVVVHVTERGYLFERVKGDLEPAGCLVPADLGAPVDLLEHKVDGFSSFPLAVDHLPLLVVDHGGRGRTGRSQLHLENGYDMNSLCFISLQIGLYNFRENDSGGCLRTCGR